MTKYLGHAVWLSCLVALLASGCSSYKSTRAHTDTSRLRALHQDVQEATARFNRHDPTMQRFFANSYGYVVFPSISKGGAGVGGAYGEGEVYERGRHVGYASLTQGTVGLQLGGQVYSEIIFFKDQARFNDFKQGNLEFSAQVSAVAATAGASANADFKEGVAVFTLPKGGLMYEAALGGQKFSYEPR